MFENKVKNIKVLCHSLAWHTFAASRPIIILHVFPSIIFCQAVFPLPVPWFSLPLLSILFIHLLCTHTRAPYTTRHLPCSCHVIQFIEIVLSTCLICNQIKLKCCTVSVHRRRRAHQVNCIAVTFSIGKCDCNFRK